MDNQEQMRRNEKVVREGGGSPQERRHCGDEDCPFCRIEKEEDDDRDEEDR